MTGAHRPASTGTLSRLLAIALCLCYAQAASTAVFAQIRQVTCIEGASLDSSTAGRADSESPPAGEAFFYLVEYHDGWSSYIR